MFGDEGGEVGGRGESENKKEGEIEGESGIRKFRDCGSCRRKASKLTICFPLYRTFETL